MSVKDISTLIIMWFDCVLMVFFIYFICVSDFENMVMFGLILTSTRAGRSK